MSTREQAIEAGARALGGANYANREDGGLSITGTAATVVDAVEPIIRADLRAEVCRHTNLHPTNANGKATT